jgi:tetratricopeptide (TPR) repeat protein
MSRVDLRGRIRAWLLFLGCAAFAAGYACFAIRGYRSFALSGENNRSALEQAIALEPRNAAADDQLCRHLRDAESNPAAALPYCWKSVRLNRYDSEEWLDLAEALYETDDSQQQGMAIEQALAVDPKTPQVAWNAASFYLLQGEVEPAAGLFASVLKGDPSLVPLTLKTSWRVLGKVDPILRMLPPNPDVYLQFVALLVAENQREAAAQVWARLIGLNTDIDYHSTLFYIDSLLRWKDVNHAEAAWKQLGAHSPGFEAYQRSEQNLVVNGSFEDEILNGGFGWRITPQGTVVNVDDETVKDGHHSMLVTYSTPVLDSGLSQFIPVAPNTVYTASAWIKSDDLQTANGPRLTAFDAYTWASLGASEPTDYTTEWRVVQTQFTTGRDTKLISLRLSRDRQDTVIRGRLWIDDVELHPSTKVLEGRR